MTPGPMRVGWARIDCDPGFQIGSDENSWAFDGFNVRFVVKSTATRLVIHPCL